MNLETEVTEDLNESIFLFLFYRILLPAATTTKPTATTTTKPTTTTKRQENQGEWIGP